jgi:hypothetical protein
MDLLNVKFVNFFKAETILNDTIYLPHYASKTHQKS